MKTIVCIIGMALMGFSCTKQEDVKPVKKEKIRLVIHGVNVSECWWGAEKQGQGLAGKWNKINSSKIDVDTTMYLYTYDYVRVILKTEVKPEFKIESFIEIYKNDVLDNRIYKKVDINFNYEVKP